MWTEERIATLKRLRLAGFSARQIAGQLGGVSRSAVLGKANRLGLCCPKKEAFETRIRTSPIKKEKREKRPQASGLAIMTLGQRAQRLDRLRTQKIPERESEPSTFCTLMELTADRCRWPIGEPGSLDFGYCGGPREVGAYCAAHAQIAYVPEKKRDAR